MKKSGDISYSAEDILLVIHSYDDIFSDFDPRSYSQKALSNDFLNECKKICDDKSEVNLRFIIPKKERNIKEEIKIKRRIREHFKRHTQIKKKKLFDIKFGGFTWFISGVIIMILAAIFLASNKNFLFNLLITLAHPAGWFFLWEGLDKILIKAKEYEPDYLFNKKMANAEITFENSK